MWRVMGSLALSFPFREPGKVGVTKRGTLAIMRTNEQTRNTTTPLTLIDGLFVGIVLVVGLRVVRHDLVLGTRNEDGLFLGGCGWEDSTIALLGGGGGFPSSRAAELLVVYLTANGGFGRLGSSFGARGR